MLLCRILSVLCCAILTSVGILHAQDKTEQVDQENWTPNEIRATFGHNEQEFTPTLDILDSLQLWHPGFGFFNPTGYIEGTGRVNIREGVDGPVIAVSNPTRIDPFYEGTVGFGFSEPVHLTPGRVYVLEPVWLSGDGGYYAATRPDLGIEYPNGRLYADGQFVNYDLMFREGMGLGIIPEPTPMVLWAVGLGLMGGIAACRSHTQRQS